MSTTDSKADASSLLEQLRDFEAAFGVAGTREVMRLALRLADGSSGPYLVATGDLLSLEEAPIGLFRSSYGSICLKTEYGDNDGRIDAFIVESGEFFRGDPPQTVESQRAQLVTPMAVVESALSYVRREVVASDFSSDVMLRVPRKIAAALAGLDESLDRSSTSDAANVSVVVPAALVRAARRALARQSSDKTSGLSDVVDATGSVGAEPEVLSDSFLEGVWDAIEAARCPSREGPYGLYDYSAYPGDAPPHVVRDYRDMNAPDYGRRVACLDDSDAARDLYERLTRRHVARAAVVAVLAHERDATRLDSQELRRLSTSLRDLSEQVKGYVEANSIEGRFVASSSDVADYLSEIGRDVEELSATLDASLGGVRC